MVDSNHLPLIYSPAFFHKAILVFQRQAFQAPVCLKRVLLSIKSKALWHYGTIAKEVVNRRLTGHWIVVREYMKSQAIKIWGKRHIVEEPHL